MSRMIESLALITCLGLGACSSGLEGLDDTKSQSGAGSAATNTAAASPLQSAADAGAASTTGRAGSAAGSAAPTPTPEPSEQAPAHSGHDGAAGSQSQHEHAGASGGAAAGAGQGMAETSQPPASSSGSGQGAAVSFKVALSPANEVPLCAAAAKWATGIGSATISNDDKSITVVLTHYNLSGDPTMAHIHSGAAGVAGPVVLNLGSALTSPIRKTFTEADYVAAKGAPADFAAFVKDMKAGNSYFNIHTAACSTGEIRGQIEDETKKPAAADKVLQFATALNPIEEVPACASAGESAAGVAVVAISADRSQLAVDLQHAGLSGAPTLAHMHAGDVGVAGPVVLSLGTDLSSPISKVFTAADYMAAQGAPADFAAFLDSLEAGKAYLNVHTQACATGEIRGQLTAPVFHARLTPVDEVPKCAAAGLLSVGAGTVIISENGTKLELELAHAGLSGAPTAAHIHAGAAGVAGPVVFNLGKQLASPIRSELTERDYIAADGAPADFAAFVTSLKAGHAYFNIHTAGCGTGEIRGQIQ